MKKSIAVLVSVVFVPVGFAIGAGVAFAGCALVLGVAARTGDSDVTTGVTLGTLAGGILGALSVLGLVRSARKRSEQPPGG